jgi:sugar lactone lactonase YvrE
MRNALQAIARRQSTCAEAYRIRLAPLNIATPAPRKLRVFTNLRGTVFPVQEGSANGIAATPNGRFLLVGHYSAGQLYRVGLSSGHVHRVRLRHGVSLNRPAGITLRGKRTLYVVEFGRRHVTKLRLSPDYDAGWLMSRTKRPSQCPTGTAG